MTHRTKHIVLLFLSAALGSMMLLSASLSNLQLNTGMPFPGGGNSETTLQPVTALPSMTAYSNPFLRGIFALLFLILMIYVSARLIALVDIKQIFKLIPIIVLLLVLVSMISRITPGNPVLLPEEPSGLAISSSTAYPTSPLGKPPRELIWFVLFVFILGAGLLAIRTMKRQLYSTGAKGQLLREAENAVKVLQAGENFKNVIIRCYLQMTHALQEEQGMERNDNMTVREFEGWLDGKGVPRVPVRQLTYLFEKVRYGNQQMSENDEKMGMESLNEIIEYCRRKKV